MTVEVNLNDHRFSDSQALSFAKILSRDWTTTRAACEPAGQCPSQSLCWARCVRRSKPALTSRSRTWRCGNNSVLLRRRSKRPRFGSLDHALWVWLSRRWAGRREALFIVRPETVIRWHRGAPMP